MSIKTAISRTIRRLNLHGVVMTLPIFGQALYDALSEEFDRVNDFRDIVTKSAVPNLNMDDSVLDDYESKYGITGIFAATETERKGRIIERASENGNGGPDWLEEQIQKAGFDLYVIVNELPYTDPRVEPGELIASSPNSNIGGVPGPGVAYPTPNSFTVPADSDTWGYVFFLSPFPDSLATSIELLGLSEQELRYLKKLVLQLKFTRNWCIMQVKGLQVKITEDSLIKLTSDGLRKIVTDNI